MADKRDTVRGTRIAVGSAIAVLAVMTGLVSYSPTLYRMFCAYTGYGGTTQRADATKALDDPGIADEITVRFDANVAPGLDWEFKPAQRSVSTHFGKPTQIYYVARNNTKDTVVAQATFNVTPDWVAPYFFKVQCFCFTSEKLAPGESAKMPVVFYVDADMLKDKLARPIKEVTLSYTFFKIDDPEPADLARTRDLTKGSRDEDETLKTAPTAAFDNDAPRS
jgi:cytochrome c oxidase assembly protein subunit 11